jgi:hypothetical protein
MREDRSYDALGRGWVFALVFAAVLILVPHTLYLERMGAIDLSYSKVSLVALLWILSYTEGANIAGPFVKSEFSLPNIDTLIWSAGIMLVSMCVFWLVYHYAQRAEQKRFPKGLVIAAIVLFLLYGSSGYMLDGMFTSVVVPFPLMQLLGSALVYARAKLGQP